MREKFKTKNDSGLAKFLFDQIEKDICQIELPKDIKGIMSKIQNIREFFNANNYDRFSPAVLNEEQKKLINYKYLINRHLSAMKSAQSYAYIFRKYQGASDYNPTKERLTKELMSKPTISEIQNELEKNLVVIRKTEIAYQGACDRIMAMVSLCEDLILNLQNAIREKTWDKKTTDYVKNQ